jgi:DNA-binding CsgD family transcriptional regulator
MQENDILKTKDVWESKNKIMNPITAGLDLNIIAQIASLFAAGSYYYYIFNFENLQMEYVHESITDVLGIAPDKFNLNKLFELMHPDDATKIHEKESTVIDFLFDKIPLEELPMYKVSYLMRLRDISGTYKTFLHQSKTIVVSKDGKIQQVMGIHTDVSHLDIPIDHKVSFLSQQRHSYYAIETNTSLELVENSSKNIFTTREKEIIKKVSEGENFKDIASSLKLSPHTITTHKKNILKKSHCNNTAELMTKCIREGVI